MIVVCNACGRKYSVQDDAIGTGKLVRCSVCGFTWKQSSNNKKESQRGYTIEVVNWTLLWFIIFLCIFSLFFARNAVQRIWPASIVLYDIVDDVVDKKKSFIIQNVSSFFVRKNKELYMGLRGEIINISDKVSRLDGIIISLKDEKNDSLSTFKKHWTHSLSQKKFLPNQKAVFETDLQLVPINNLICDIDLNTL